VKVTEDPRQITQAGIQGINIFIQSFHNSKIQLLYNYCTKIILFTFTCFYCISYIILIISMFATFLIRKEK